MRKNIHTIRPASAAIAAALAFASTPLLAQTVVVPPVAADAAPQSEATSAAAPVFAPQQPVVQPTPSVDERLTAAIAASEAETAEPAAPASASAARTPSAKVAAPRSAMPKSSTVAAAERTAQPAPPLAAQEETAPVAPVTPVAADPVPAAAMTQPTPVEPPVTEPTARSTDPALLWAMGGGALLLLGLGGAALMRRRRPDETGVTEEPVYAAPAPLAEPVVAPAPVPRAAPMPIAHRVATDGSEEARLEAMVAAPPSAENPFRTYSKRMTRAKFLLAQEQRAAQPQSFASPAAPAPTPVQPTAQPTQTVYRFGADKGRKGVFNPRTS